MENTSTTINTSMTGIELIAQERKEQIEKHKWNDKFNINYELLKMAHTALTNCEDEWPENFSTIYRDKILSKPRIEQLAIAGALIAAEIDRLNASN